MKHSILYLALFFSLSVSAQNSLVKLWSTDTVLAIPESVLFDAKDQLLYVSLIDGHYSTKDGKGAIAKLGLDGTIINVDWVSGLNAPKGMGRYKNTLYVADLTEVVLIDIQEAKILQKIPVEGARFLNDIAVSSKGDMYISDSETGKIHLLKNGKLTTVVSGLKKPNGVLVKKEKLYILANGELLEADQMGKTKVLATGMDTSTDGIEEVIPGEFIVSSWMGAVYLIKPNLPNQQLLDTRPMQINTADIGYDPVKRIVYIPTFYKKQVVAYQLY